MVDRFLLNHGHDGIVRLTLRPAQCRDEHSPAPLPSASLSARNHQPCRLALPQILHELPGCSGGFAGRTRNHRVVRNHSAVVRGNSAPTTLGKLKRRQGRLGDTWFLDEVFVTINGQRQYLWRAVDQDGDLIDILVQPRRDGRAARRFFRPTVEESATGTRAARDRQAGQLPCRTSGPHAAGHP